MTVSEEFLLEVLSVHKDCNAQAMLLQDYIQTIGPLSEEAAAKVRELLKKGE
jgi:hypothetical protein